MLESVEAVIRRVGHDLSYSDKQLDALLEADAEHTFDIKLKSGKQFKAYRVQNNNKLGPYKGGIRFHPKVDLAEAKALAALMSLKTAAVGLPLGGGKGGIAVDPKELTSKELEELSRTYAARLASHIGPDKDIPAPDVNTNSKIIDWMVEEYENQTGDKSHASFTGKSLEKGGSLGREAATGRGGVYALKKYLELTGKAGKNLTIAVQGYGNVGSFFATVAKSECPNWKLISASDTSATLVNQTGLDPQQLARFKTAGKRFSAYINSHLKTLPPERIIETEADVLVLAALDDAINSSNMRQVKAKYIVELANGPVDDTAHDYLTKKGHVVLPDIIANAGGVIVSYLEWLQNKSGERWSEEKVNKQLKSQIDDAVSTIFTMATEKDVSLKEAAYRVALNQLIK